MPLRKMHKKDFKVKMKDQIGDTIHRGRSTKTTLKYNYKNYWLEEELNDVIPVRLKKKKAEKAK